MILVIAATALAAPPSFADDAVKLDTSATKTAAPILFQDAKGDVHPLNARDNKLTAVHFWAVWCVPCVAELPQVDATAQTYEAKGLKIITISQDGDKNMGKVSKFFADHTINHLTPYLDFGGASFKGAQAKGLPTTLFIDNSGKEIARADGPLDWKNPETTKSIEEDLK